MAQEYDDIKATECHCGLPHPPGSLGLGQFVTEIATLPSCLLTQIFAVMCLVAETSTVKLVLGINYDFSLSDSITFGVTFCTHLKLNYFYSEI